MVRKVHNIFIELTHEAFRIPLLEFEEPNILFFITFQESKVIIKRKLICQKYMIEEITKLINEINSLNQDGVRAQYQKKIKTARLGSGSIKLEWLDIRRKSYPNPIQYEIQPFDENYSIFEVRITINANS